MALEQLEKLAAGGDPVALSALAETGTWLGIGIRSLINIFNPEVIVLGGLYHRFFDYLMDAVNESAQGAIDVARGMVKIVRSTVGCDAPLIGAAELVLEDVIESPAVLLRR